MFLYTLMYEFDNNMEVEERMKYSFHFENFEMSFFQCLLHFSFVILKFKLVIFELGMDILKVTNFCLM